MKVGFIGLGIMGKPMAKNLLKAGHEVCVNDFHPESVAELVEAGATSAATNAEVAKDVEVVITMVPNSPNVRAALLEKTVSSTEHLLIQSLSICHRSTR